MSMEIKLIVAIGMIIVSLFSAFVFFMQRKFHAGTWAILAAMWAFNYILLLTLKS
jgi:hypothetical protein